MKKILIYSLLVAVLFGNSGAGCGGSEADDPQPDKFQSLLGKWEIQSSAYNITRQNGSTFQDKVDFKARNIKVVWEFFSDGRLVVTSDGASAEIRWKLNATKVNSGDIDAGNLVLISPEYKKLAAELGQPGDYTFEIVTVAAPGTATRMSLSVDMTKTGPYKENVLVFVLHKV